MRFKIEEDFDWGENPEIKVTSDNFYCEKCRKWFQRGYDYNSCAVMHSLGDCCHFTDTEIEPPQPERIASDGEVVFPDTLEFKNNLWWGNKEVS